MNIKINIHPHAKRKVNPYEDLTGRVFSRLTVVEESSTHRSPCGTRRIQWLCHCICGNTCVARGDHLRRGNTTSCGCVQGESNKTHGMAYTPEWNSYHNAKQRCNDPKATGYSNYGGAGVRFNFKSFEEFFAELGYRPSLRHSVDRINPFGNYERGNVRWATSKEQAQNTRKKFLIRNAIIEGMPLIATPHDAVHGR